MYKQPEWTQTNQKDVQHVDVRLHYWHSANIPPRESPHSGPSAQNRDETIRTEEVRARSLLFREHGFCGVRVRRTFESHGLVELAAIAVAGLGLFAAGGHQIRDIALSGTSADYLVDDENYRLEISGRSSRRDFHTAWDTRWNRLVARCASGFFLCVSEFETPAGRLAFTS